MKVRLDEVCNIYKGKTTITKAIPGEYPLVVTAENRASHNEYQFDCKAVCVPLVSATGHGHASIKRLHYQEGKFALGTILSAVIPKDENILDTRYLYIYLSYFKDSVLVPLMRGSANVSLTIKSLGSAEIELPPIEKQKSIVELVTKIEKYKNEVDKKLEEQTRIVSLLRNEILGLAVKGKPVPQDENDEPASVLIERIKAEKDRLIKEKVIKKEKYNSEIDINEELPIGWSFIKIGDVSSVVTKQTGFDYSKHIKPNLEHIKKDDNIPMIQTKNFTGYIFNTNTDYYISEEIAKKFPKILLYKKCMLLSIVGASIGNLGVYTLNKTCFLGGAICKVDLLDDRFYDFIYYFMKSTRGQLEIKKNYKSTAQGTITVQDVREIIVPLPPLNEQKRIVEKVDNLMKVCDELELRIEESKKYNEKLMESILKESFKA